MQRPSELRIQGILGSAAEALLVDEGQSSSSSSNTNTTQPPEVQASDYESVSLSGAGAEVFSSKAGLLSRKLGILRLGFVGSKALSTSGTYADVCGRTLTYADVCGPGFRRFLIPLDLGH